MKKILILIMLLSVMTVSAGVGGIIGIDLNDEPDDFDNATAYVNNSQYLQGYTPTTLKNWFDTLYCKLTGCHITGDFEVDGTTILNGNNYIKNQIYMESSVPLFWFNETDADADETFTGFGVEDGDYIVRGLNDDYSSAEYAFKIQREGGTYTNFNISNGNFRVLDDQWCNSTNCYSLSDFLDISYTETDPYWTANYTAFNTTWATDTDTNETSRIENMTAYDCAGNVLVGFYVNGSAMCEADNTGDSNNPFENDTTQIYVKSGYPDDVNVTGSYGVYFN